MIDRTNSNRNLSVAVVGAGFSGLAVCRHLMNQISCELTLFDPAGIGGGASGVSMGLLHRYAGRRARPAWEGEEGMRATEELLARSALALGREVITSRGLFRPACTPERLVDFAACAREHPDVDWWEPEETARRLPLLEPLPGIYIRTALTIDSVAYLEGLWRSCEAEGAQFERKRVSGGSELEDFDVVVLALGASIGSFPNYQGAAVTPIKGQILEMSWPDELSPLPMSVAGKGYVTMAADGKSCFIGGTFERKFSDEGPDMDIARPLLMEKLASFFPRVTEMEVLNCRAGVRASSSLMRRPFIHRHDPRTWVIAGMGSKGLLYHSLVAGRLAQEIGETLSSG